MCSPEYFGVEYVINPWMADQTGKVRPREAMSQWSALYDALSPLADITCIAPSPHQPDMVFTANAGMVFGDRFVPSRFRHQERAGEEAHFACWAEHAAYAITPLPDDVFFEGAGDALYDRGRPVLWLGYGFRTGLPAASALRDIVEPSGLSVQPLRLVDPRFYHLDTCFCPISGGRLLYYPPAFDPESVRRIEGAVPEDQRLAVSEEDAEAFACNAVCLNGAIVMNRATSGLKARLGEWGLRCVETPLGEFMRAGGAARCLTLRLDEPEPVAA
jgi:N-dimethylarginine dimethylaminohydrolase